MHEPYNPLYLPITQLNAVCSQYQFVRKAFKDRVDMLMRKYLARPSFFWG